MSVTPQSPGAIGTQRYLAGTTIETGITATASGTQTTAYQLKAQMNVISVCATAGDSVALPNIDNFQPGDARIGALAQLIFIRNDGAASCQVFGVTPDTVNGVATATGVALPSKAWMIAWPVAFTQSTGVGVWNALIAQDLGNAGLVVPSPGITPISAPSGFRNFFGGSVTDGTDTAFASGTLFVTSIFIPVNMTLTGIGFLMGSVGGTNRVVVQLNSAAGALLANSTLASSGTVAGTAAQTQKIDFTATYAAKGPATYFIGVSANGNTAKILTVPAYRAPELFSASLSQTAATPAAIVAPSSFSADVAPIAFVY